jgi:hypothetical protein
VCIGINGSDLDDLACIHILSGASWIPRRIVEEHPAGCLDRSIAESLQILRANDVAFVIDADATAGERKPDYCRAVHQIGAKPRLWMRQVQRQPLWCQIGQFHDPENSAPRSALMVEDPIHVEQEVLRGSDLVEVRILPALLED